MTKLIPLLVAVAVLAAVAVGASAAAHPTVSAVAAAGCPTVTDGQLTIGTDNPAYPPWYAGGTKSSKWKINDPATGKGYESAVAYAIASKLGYTKSHVSWTYVPFNRAYAPGSKSFDFDINQISYTPARAKVVDFSKSYYDVNQAIVVNKGTKIASVRSIKGLASYKLGAQLGTTSYAFIKSRIKPSQQPAVYNSNAAAVLSLKNKQIDGLVVDLPTAFYVTAVQVPNGKILGQFENGSGTSDRPLRSRPREGEPADGVCQPGDHVVAHQRHAQAASAAVAGEGDRRADLEVERRSRLLDGLRSGGDGRRSVVIALVSTFVFFGAVFFAITHAPGWPQVRSQFFNWQEFKSSMPEIARAFVLNVKIFSIAEVFILAFALFLAVLRSLPGPVFFPLRALAIVYADLFRGIPTILVIAILGFGAPALGLSYVPKSVVFWGIVSLVLIYSAYVSEVYRAGIESIHPSQEAAARSLGLSRWQTLRRVILPQAVRRVVPPLLNDFIGLQKDTALVGTLGAVEAFQQSQIDTNATFNFTAYLCAALLFVAITIPLARFTDWLILRDRRRRQAGGATL